LKTALFSRGNPELRGNRHKRSEESGERDAFNQRREARRLLPF
jgi:hypothetical protein